MRRILDEDRDSPDIPDVVIVLGHDMPERVDACDVHVTDGDREHGSARGDAGTGVERGESECPR